MFHKCHFEGNIMGSCNNQNFGNKLCYYHQKVTDGFIKPETTTVTLSSLPSHINIGD